MTDRRKLVFAATAALVAVAAFLLATRRGAPLPAAGSASLSPAAAVPRTASIEVDPAGERREVEAGPASVPAADERHAFELRIRVLDRDGLAAVDRAVVVAPADCVPNAWPRKTDRDGSVLATWRARAAVMSMLLGVVEDLPRGHVPALRRIEVQAGRPLEVTLLRDPVACTRDQTPTATRTEFLPGCARCHGDGARFRALLDADLDWWGKNSARPDAPAGSTPFADRLLPTPATTSIFEDMWESSVGDTAAIGVLHGTVRDAAGNPAAGVTVAWGREPDRPGGRTVTDEQGEYSFSWLPPGRIEVRAGGGDLGLARLTVEVPAVSTSVPQRADLWLEKGATVRGRALDLEGGPLAGFVVELLGLDGRWVDACTTRADGSFELPNQPPGPSTLLLTRAAGDLPIASASNVTADGPELRLGLRESGPADGSIRIRVRAEVDARAVEVRAWHLASGRGRALTRQGEEFSTDGLPAGRYHLEIGAEACGRLDLGEVPVDGRTGIDLGEVVLPAPAELRMTGAVGLLGDMFARPAIDPDEVPSPAIDEWTGAVPAILPALFSRRPYGLVRAVDVWAPSVPRVPLPAGSWLLVWRDRPDGPLRHLAFDAAPGEPVTIDLR
jgi:mono/diheme cytochrome c family protein